MKDKKNLLEKNKKEEGITLVALVITVIIMLILAGVAISVIISDGGIIERIKSSKEIYDIANEKEVIYTESLLVKIDAELSKDAQYLGKKLYDKTIANGNIWNIIYDFSSNIAYGTNWNFIEKGTYIEDYGNTQNAWLLNTETLELIRLEENNFSELSYDISLGVKENLIFNLDSSVISEGDKENIESELGEGVELLNFDWNEDSGITTKSFNLDGVDDYIKIQYDKSEEKEILSKNGFTFEFYGILNPGTCWYSGKPATPDSSTTYRGIFCYFIEDGISAQAAMRFGIQNNVILKWNAGYANNASDYSENGSPWNINYEFEKSLYNRELYFTITLDVANSYEKDGITYYPQCVYVNGVKMFEGGYNKEEWNNFVNNYLARLTHFYIGKSTMVRANQWYYTEMEAYALRLYNRALSSEEVIKNYSKTVAYHNLISSFAD